MTNHEIGVVFFSDEEGTLDRVYETFMHSFTPEPYTEGDSPYIIKYQSRKSKKESLNKQEEEGKQ